MTTALIVGGSGATGRALLAQAVHSGRFAHIHLPVRRPLGLAAAPGVHEQVRAALDPWSLDIAGRVDVLFCTLGTTIKQAGSQEAFRRVDHDLIVAFGRWAADRGVPQMHVVSSIGADPSSRNFYLRVKGEAERDLAGLGLPSLYLYRPSLLHAGNRPDSRLGERMAFILLSVLNPIPLPFARRYRPVPVERLAAAMLRSSAQPESGTQVVLSEKLH